MSIPNKEINRHIRNMELSTIYVNKLILDEKVIIVDMDSKQMWGLHSKEYVSIVKFKHVGTGFISSSTLSNFIMKYEDIQEIRDRKINDILG